MTLLRLCDNRLRYCKLWLILAINSFCCLLLINNIVKIMSLNLLALSLIIYRRDTCLPFICGSTAVVIERVLSSELAYVSGGFYIEEEFSWLKIMLLSLLLLFSLQFSLLSLRIIPQFTPMRRAMFMASMINLYLSERRWFYFVFGKMLPCSCVRSMEALYSVERDLRFVWPARLAGEFWRCFICILLKKIGCSISLLVFARTFLMFILPVIRSSSLMNSVSTIEFSMRSNLHRLLMSVLVASLKLGKLFSASLSIRALAPRSLIKIQISWTSMMFSRLMTRSNSRFRFCGLCRTCYGF